MEDQESTATDADELTSAVKTEEGMTAIAVRDKEDFKEESSIVKATEVPSSLTDEEDRVRIAAEEEEKAAFLKVEAEVRAARFQSLEEMCLGIEAQVAARKLCVQNEHRRTESENGIHCSVEEDYECLGLSKCTSMLNLNECRRTKDK